VRCSGAKHSNSERLLCHQASCFPATRLQSYNEVVVVRVVVVGVERIAAPWLFVQVWLLDGRNETTASHSQSCALFGELLLHRCHRRFFYVFHEQRSF